MFKLDSTFVLKKTFNETLDSIHRRIEQLDELLPSAPTPIYTVLPTQYVNVSGNLVVNGPGTFQSIAAAELEATGLAGVELVATTVQTGALATSTTASGDATIDAITVQDLQIASMSTDALTVGEGKCAVCTVLGGAECVAVVSEYGQMGTVHAGDQYATDGATTTLSATYSTCQNIVSNTAEVSELSAESMTATGQSAATTFTADNLTADTINGKITSYQAVVGEVTESTDVMFATAKAVVCASGNLASATADRLSTAGMTGVSGSLVDTSISAQIAGGDDAYLTGTLTTTTATAVDATIGGKSEVDGPILVTGNLTVLGDVDLSKTVFFTNFQTFDGEFTGMSIDTLTVVGDATVSTFNVDGDMHANHAIVDNLEVDHVNVSTLNSESGIIIEETLETNFLRYNNVPRPTITADKTTFHEDVNVVYEEKVDDQERVMKCLGQFVFKDYDAFTSLALTYNLVVIFLNYQLKTILGKSVIGQLLPVEVTINLPMLPLSVLNLWVNPVIRQIEGLVSFTLPDDLKDLFGIFDLERYLNDVIIGDIGNINIYII
jgi:hypothetical protein